MDRARFVASLRHGNLTFDVMTCSAIGGGTLGLFFFVVDAIAGQPLHTPMVLGSILFQGTAAAQVGEVDINIVAGYTFVHFAAFAVIGVFASLLAHAADHAEDPATLVAIGIFGLELASFVGLAFVFPGAISELGVARIALANVLAGGCIAWYLVRYRHRLEWREPVHPHGAP